MNRGRQGPGPQDNGQVTGFIHGKGAGDLGLPSGDPFLNDRGRLDDLIQNNGQLAVDIVPGDLIEDPAAVVVELDTDIGFIKIPADLDLSAFLWHPRSSDSWKKARPGCGWNPAGFPIDLFPKVDFPFRRDLVLQGLVQFGMVIFTFNLAAVNGLFDKTVKINLRLDCPPV